VKSENEILTKVDRKDIEPGGNDHWIDVPMRVPKVPPSRLDNCSIINISYHIEVTDASLVYFFSYSFIFSL